MNGYLDSWLETDDFEDYGEDIFDTEDYEGEDYGEFEGAESRASKRRAKRKRQALMAQRRATLQQRGPSAMQRMAPVSRALKMAEKADLENKVQGDVFNRVLKAQRDRISRNEYALATSSVIDELKKVWPKAFEGELGALLPLASLLVLKPEQTGSGINALFKDPRFLAPALVLGLKLYSENRDKGIKVTPDNLKLKAPAGGAAGASKKLRIRDKNGQLLDSSYDIKWDPADTTLVDVTKDGVVTAKGATGDQTSIDAMVTKNGVTTIVTVEVDLT